MTRARLYRTLRTAHLERALQLSPATIVYRDRRYDFDEALAARLDLVRAGGPGAALHLLRAGVTELEVNEPLMRSGIRTTALAVAALRVRERCGGPRAEVVSCAIENLDPFARPARGLRARAGVALDRSLARFVWRNLDRVVHGTEATRDLYGRVLPPPRPGGQQTVVLMLPQPCDCPDTERDPSSVLFLGAFSPRKGFDLLHRAWPEVHAGTGARLSLLGKGPLEERARAWAGADTSVALSVDPTRESIHRALRRAQVLVLPSQPRPAWREQLGLPILEALAHGCTVVTTSETGLAPWLARHGHTVLPPGEDPGALARALVERVREPLPAARVLAPLPARDGRLAADDWLFATPAGGTVSAG